MSDARMAELQSIADDARQFGRIDAIVSTDGDSDRPLVAGVDALSGVVRFVGGDLLGIIVADWLVSRSAVGGVAWCVTTRHAQNAHSVAVPISSNDAVRRCCCWWWCFVVLMAMHRSTSISKVAVL
jgi:phosphomannomutase